MGVVTQQHGAGQQPLFGRLIEHSAQLLWLIRREEQVAARR